MRNPPVLNDFEKKCVIESLKDFKVVNLVLDVNSFNEVHYIIFYEYKSVLFAHRVLFTIHYEKYDGIVSDFIRICNLMLSTRYKIHDKYLSFEAPLDANEILYSVNETSSELFSLLHYLKLSNIVSLPSVNNDYVHECVENGLRDGLCISDSYWRIFDLLKIDTEVLIEYIKSHQ